jgi:TonB-linked SusC/RagA family outer membrane protein
MYRLGLVMAFLLLWVSRPVVAQTADTPDASPYLERGPRFLLASASAPKLVDVRKTKVLRQRISLDLQDVPLAEALRDVSRKSGMRLAFSDAVVPPQHTVQFRADNITVAAALTELLIDTGVDILFSRDGGGVLVRRQFQLAVIRGTVTDSAGEALPGAMVSIPGTSHRAETSETGQYVLSDVSPGTVVIRAQSIGYVPQERRVAVEPDAQLTVNFVMARGIAQLEEVVSVGYGSKLRGELSTSVSSVSAAEIANQPIASIDGALQGKAAGVQVTQNAGNPGNGMSMRIRGTASVSAGSDPLYVVDGVPIVAGDISQLGLGGQTPAAISGLSPDDIDRVDVLKDAAATAIYGSRGSNGVVLITTKRGVEGKPTVTFNSYVGTQSASKRLDLLNSTQYLEIFRESALNDGYDLADLDPNYFGEVGVADSLDTDWQSAILRSAPVSSAELAVSGGDDRLRYRVAGTWFDQVGIVTPSGYRRVGGRLNLDFNPARRLSLSTSLTVTSDHNDRVEGDGDLEGIVTNAIGESPLSPIRLSNGDFAGPDDDLVYVNPVALAALNPVNARSTNILGSVEARLRITPSLQYTSRLGVDLVDLKEDQFLSRRVNGSEGAGLGGSAKKGFSSSDRYVIDNFLTLAPDLGGRHELEATAGGSLELTRSELNFVRGDGFSSDELTQVDNAAVISAGNGTNSRNNLISFFARGSYTLDRKYTFGASVRTDGSSRFGVNDRWGFFPSVSAAWLLSEEPFLKGGFFDFLKVRASYGLTGNQAISDFPYQGLIGSANYGDNPGNAPSNLANPDLKWETTKQFDAGVDLAFAHQRVSVTADYYEKRTNDLLLERPISGTSGFTTVFDNVGSVFNKGWELALTTVNIDSRKADGFRWTTTLNLAANRNRVTALFEDQPFNSGERDINRVQVGQPLGAFQALNFLGVDPATGNAIFQDVNGDGEITADDEIIVGSPWPDFTGGLTSTFTYKGFDLTGFLVFSVGNDIFNAMRIFADNGACSFDNQFSNTLRRWKKPGDITDVPRASFDCASGASDISSRYIEDGSYGRLQDLTLGYTLPDRVSGRLGFASARIYGSVRNLFTITDYSGYSPDVNSNGANNVDSGSLATSSQVGLGTDFYAYPQARTWTFGVQASW